MGLVPNTSKQNSAMTPDTQKKRLTSIIFNDPNVINQLAQAEKDLVGCGPAAAGDAALEERLRQQAAARSKAASFLTGGSLTDAALPGAYPSAGACAAKSKL
ncbi:hypothetical protein [Paenibacillus oceani]|uniref:Uncharacterized protein n=1 Tax=Paenibacillus oceani TaxID=2772510 RepID=A0A927CHJ0_9BACL|nr:hypothetical protein [Paenibacillus oceani]MBD2866723.1 hypothetical protein [Paenibacillus oceani]